MRMDKLTTKFQQALSDAHPFIYTGGFSAGKKSGSQTSGCFCRGTSQNPKWQNHEKGTEVQGFGSGRWRSVHTGGVSKKAE